MAVQRPATLTHWTFVNNSSFVLYSETHVLKGPPSCKIADIYSPQIIRQGSIHVVLPE